MSAFRRAWTMRLKEGAESRYDAAHAAVWPELLAQMRASGIERFHLFRDGTTVFAFQERQAPFPSHDTSPAPVTLKWWREMEALMETDAEGRPIHNVLTEVFALPEMEIKP
ncbi:L-rhamnose mutarotase [Pseudoruegeria sp. SHC-113]|uniref:L-rhamnose mutarotase n=1 Tax=Pseudoruegeria sp. SHC-113 TaxID=2855439 RepID=UPI0021BA7CB3|nr:L-rhamnose mutarotase [Pseudoruegeria sp. SHC-113]MCT8158671.1 L-rhamnose mutarotase [Pseudoruegeria sp. SHC-113]